MQRPTEPIVMLPLTDTELRATNGGEAFYLPFLSPEENLVLSFQMFGPSEGSSGVDLCSTELKFPFYG